MNGEGGKQDEEEKSKVKKPRCLDTLLDQIGAGGVNATGTRAFGDERFYSSWVPGLV
jgi:hypothetical protein